MFRRLAPVLLAVACSSEPSTNSTSSNLQCFHGASSISCKAISRADERVKVEDFYPSACLDGDADLDGTPDFIDFDFLGTEAEAEAIARDDLRCPRCNRGPGTQNDFRLRITGTVGQLERGKVYTRNGGTLEVPTPDGVLTIAITSATQVEDGDPAPGAEIRVDGAIKNGVFEATRLKVLCPAPAAMPDGETPPDTDQPPAQPAGPLLL